MKHIALVFLLMYSIATCLFAEDNRKHLDFSMDPVIPHFAVGGPEWQTTFIFHNPSDTLEKFYLNFTDDNGKPLPIPALGSMLSSILVTLPPHTTRKLVSDYRPDLSIMSGGARITDPYSCSDCNFYYSTVHTIFARYDWVKKAFNSEATVPQESRFDNNIAMIYDQQNNFNMGVALMNPSDYEIKLVTVTVYDQDNNLLQADQFYMDPLDHLVFDLDAKYPVTKDKIGYIKFSTTGLGGIAGIALRFAPNYTFTSMHFITMN